MGERPRYRGSKLFLVRFWAMDGNESLEDHNDDNEIVWRGKVQRVTDGESHRFSDLQGFIDQLQEMLSNNTRR